MAFEAIPTPRRGNGVLVNAVSVGFIGSGAVQIMFSKDLFEWLGSPVAFRVLKGTGQDHGFLKFVPENEEGPGKQKVWNKQISFRARSYDIPAMSRGRAPLPFTKNDDKTVTVDFNSVLVPAKDLG